MESIEAPMIPLLFDASVAYTAPGKLQVPNRPASVPSRWRISDSSFPKEGVSLGSSASMASYIFMRVASDIFPFVLIKTVIIILCVASSSFSSRHHPLYLLIFPSALAASFDSLKGGEVLLFSPCGWARRIRLSAVERMGSNCCCSF